MPGPLDADMHRTPAAARAVQHVHRCGFALRLDEDPAHAREIQRGRLGDFAGRSDGVSIIGAASRQDGRLDDRLITLGEFRFHRDRLCTIMPPGSGQAK